MRRNVVELKRQRCLLWGIIELEHELTMEMGKIARYFGRLT
jgi:hypothetical protein